jgi:hypothetical protein
MKRIRRARVAQCPWGDCTYLNPSATHLRKHEEEDAREKAAAVESKRVAAVALKGQLAVARAAIAALAAEDDDGADSVWFDAIAPPRAIAQPHAQPHPNSHLFAARDAAYNLRLLADETPALTPTQARLEAARAALLAAASDGDESVGDDMSIDDVSRDYYDTDALGYNAAPAVPPSLACDPDAHPDVPPSLHRSQRDCAVHAVYPLVRPLHIHARTSIAAALTGNGAGPSASAGPGCGSATQAVVLVQDAEALTALEAAEEERLWRYFEPLEQARRMFAANGAFGWAKGHCGNGVLHSKPLPTVVPLGSVSTERNELGLSSLHMSSVNRAEISASGSFAQACIDLRCALIRNRPPPGGVAVPSGKGDGERVRFAVTGAVYSIELQAMKWQLQHGLSAAAIVDITKDQFGGAINVSSVKVLFTKPPAVPPFILLLP